MGPMNRLEGSLLEDSARVTVRRLHVLKERQLSTYAIAELAPRFGLQALIIEGMLPNPKALLRMKPRLGLPIQQN